MQPVRTDDTNLTIQGHPDEGVDDLPATLIGVLDADGLRPVGFATTWALNPAERAAIAAGADLRLTTWAVPHPPVALEVVLRGDVVPGEPDAGDGPT